MHLKKGIKVSKNFLKITDLVKFSLVDPNLMKVKDDYEGAFKPEAGGQTHPSGMGTTNSTPVIQNGLQVRIAATHSGIITRNNGFYLPDKMKAGASSFTDNYPKPILLHHADHEDPVGRVIEAAYMDTSGMVQDAYNGLVVRDKNGKEVGTITDTLIQDFVSKKMPFGMQVDVVCNILRDSLLNDNEYAGLGHIQLVANITDKAAIEKLLDGRYLTGSVGATTDAAVCSVCRQDWTESGQCEHKPGGLYDGTKCFLIAGKLAYEEYSFVNAPADRHSGVLELNYNGVQDNVEIANDYHGRIYEVQLAFPQFDSVIKEDEGMAKKKKEAQVKPEGTEVVIEDSNTPKPPEGDKPAETPATDDKPAETPVQDAKAEGTEGGDEPVEGTPEPTPDTPVEDGASGKEGEVKDEAGEETLEDFLIRVVDAESLEDEDEQKFYDMLWDEAVAGFEDGEFTLEELGVEKLEDAKLSTEKRKKLASSTFCGPKKSFPVPDCAHVTAARRLIGKYKGEGDKTKILACVSRKAKALGCDTKKTKKDAVENTPETPAVEDAMHHARMMHVILAALEENEWTPPDKEPALSNEDKNALASILKKLAGQVGKDALSQVLVTEGLAVNPECTQALENEVEKAENTIGNLRDELDALRKEWSLLFKDMETLQDSLVSEKTNVRKAQEAHLATLTTLRDAKVEEKDFSELEDTALVSELERLTGEVDMTKITDKLGDGMSRVPTDGVDDPTEVHDDNQKSKISLDDLKKIQENHIAICLRDGEIAGEAYLERMKREGKLPRDEE